MTKNKNLIRYENLNILKQFLFKRGTSLKAEMSKETGISVVTINSLVRQLIEKNIFIEGDLTQQPLGRPAIIYHFNYNQSHFLLLSIQKKKISENRKLIIVGKIVNLAGEVTYENIFDFSEITLEFLVSKINHFLELDYDIDKIGLSIPGKIYNGVIISSLEDLLNHWNIEEKLSKVTSIPLVIQNDAHLLTVGYTILHKLSKSETIVGIFYPENSEPGITIYYNGSILEGGHNLAGEAKYLPHLIKASTPSNEVDFINNLIEILSIYNAVIAPNSFVISADSISEGKVLNAIEKSSIIPKQINKPNILFVENFQNSLEIGLLWLVTQNSIYQL